MAVALPAIALGSSLVGTGLSAVGQISQGRQQKAGYEYNARVAEENAKAIRVKGAFEEAQSREKLRVLSGKARADYAASGVDIGSGSPLTVMAHIAAEGKKETEMIRYGTKVEEYQQLNQAKLDRMYGKQVASAGLWGGTSTFFSGLGQAGLGYYNYYGKKS